MHRPGGNRSDVDGGSCSENAGCLTYDLIAPIDDTEAGNAAGSGPTPPCPLEEPVPSVDPQGLPRGETVSAGPAGDTPAWTAHASN